MYTIAAVIPTFNRKAHLAQTIRDLQAQVGSRFRLEVIIAVDGSTDGTLQMLSHDFPDVHIVKGDGNWWYTRSMNEGFQRAVELSADYVLTLNDDIRLDKNYVNSLFNAAKAQGSPGIMGSISVTESMPHRITFSGIKEITWWRFKYHSYLQHYAEVEVNRLTGVQPSKVLPGRGMLIPMHILKDMKCFDAKLIQYGSDDDFCLRAQKKGYSVNVSYDAVVYSYDKMTGVGNSARKDSLMDMIRAFRNRYSTLYLPKTMEMIKRHGNSLLMPLTLSIVILGSLKSKFKYKNA